MIEALANLLCLTVWGTVGFAFGRVYEARVTAMRGVEEAGRPSLVEDDRVEPEPITKRNPNLALAALAMRWDQESWPGALSDEDGVSYHHAEVER